MRRNFVPVETVAKEWLEDPSFVVEYDALEEEFVRAVAVIRRSDKVDKPRLPSCGHKEREHR